MSISYEEMGQVVVTCKADENVNEGCVVCMDENDTVTACAAGKGVCGVALHVSGDGYAAVQIKGMVSVACASGVKPGLLKITAQDGVSIKAAGEADEGRDVLVMNVKDSMAVICL